MDISSPISLMRKNEAQRNKEVKELAACHTVTLGAMVQFQVVLGARAQGSKQSGQEGDKMARFRLSAG